MLRCNPQRIELPRGLDPLDPIDSNRFKLSLTFPCSELRILYPPQLSLLSLSPGF